MIVYDVFSIVSKNSNVSDGKLLPKCDNNVSKSGFVRGPCYGTCKIVQWATLLLMPKKTVVNLGFSHPLAHNLCLRGMKINNAQGAMSLPKRLKSTRSVEQFPIT